MCRGGGRVVRRGACGAPLCVSLRAMDVAEGPTFFLQNGHKEDAKFMKELFEYFNRRYDDQNNDLQSWLQQKGEFTEKEKLGFIDYFNLCAEESVFQKLGYIYDEVWKTWLN